MSKLLLFAAPNDGAGLARVGKVVSWRQPQVKQLCRRSEFIDQLNREWAALNVGDRLDVAYVVAGHDAVVDSASARGLPGVRAEVATLTNDDHRSCTKPRSRKDVPYTVLKDFVLSPPPKPAAKVLARPRADKLARAALALSYDTWRTLTRDEGLTDAQAAQVAVGLAAEET